MKRLIIIFIIALVYINNITPSLYGAERYYHIAKWREGVDDWSIDTQSLRYDNKTNIVRFWCVHGIPIAKRNDNVAYVKYFIEIDIPNKTYRLLEEHKYDANRHIVRSSRFNDYSLNNIIPSSVVDGLYHALSVILRNKEYELKSSNDVGKIIVTSLLIGIIVSGLVVFIYKKLLPDTIITGMKKKDYIDVEFTETTHDEEFDYPYEDMDEVLGER